MTIDVATLLDDIAAGDVSARDRLYSALYPDLMRLARAHLSRAGTVSLDAPALLHDAYLRLGGRTDLNHRNANVFFAYASKVMRSVLVDYVRERKAQKRGSGERMLTLTTGIAEEIFDEDTLDELHVALQALERVDERSHRVVEMRYFGGLTEDEVAAALQISVPTVKRDWRKARAFLLEYMQSHR